MEKDRNRNEKLTFKCHPRPPYNKHIELSMEKMTFLHITDKAQKGSMYSRRFLILVNFQLGNDGSTSSES